MPPTIKRQFEQWLSIKGNKIKALLGVCVLLVVMAAIVHSCG